MQKQPLLESVPVDARNLIPKVLSVEVHGKPSDFRLQHLDDGILLPEEKAMLCEIIADRGIDRLFVPRLDKCNATFGSEEEFDINIELPGVLVSKSRASIDALRLRKRTAGLIRSADCPTIILWHERKNIMLVGHGSRDSLLDREFISGGKLWRKSPSVIRSMMKEFKGFRPVDIYGHIACGILPKHFEHHYDDPKYGEYNQNLIRNIRRLFPACLKSLPGKGCIDLAELAKQQLCHWFNIPRGNIYVDNLDTFEDPRLHSHRAGDRGRNGVFVFHT